jgi:hypothetical protein
VWLVRRRQGSGTDIYLRVWAEGRELPIDADAEIAVVWFACAYPDWPTERCRKWGRRALRRRRAP